MIKEQCAICGKVVAVLAKHVKQHKLTSEEYYRKYLMKPGEGVCKTCGAPTKFCGLTEKRFAPYCSNKCHNSDKDAILNRVLKMRNRSPEEKAASRAKQIAAWEKSMGPEWSKVMNQRSIDGYDRKHPGNAGGPFASKEVRKKCEKTWGCKAPGQKPEIREILSEKTTKQMKEVHANCVKREYEIIKNHVENVYYDKEIDKFVYTCDKCKKFSYLSLQRIRYANDNKHYNTLCEHCYNLKPYSYKEKELCEYIKSIYSGEIIESDRKQLHGKEIDIFLPELKLGFEFDGTHWHADPRYYKPDEMVRVKNVSAKTLWESDANKDRMCEEIGIKLIRIKEHDWDNDNINTKTKIREVINNVKCKNER